MWSANSLKRVYVEGAVYPRGSRSSWGTRLRGRVGIFCVGHMLYFGKRSIQEVKDRAPAFPLGRAYSRRGESPRGMRLHFRPRVVGAGLSRCPAGTFTPIFLVRYAYRGLIE